jgi:hypothetical protein
MRMDGGQLTWRLRSDWLHFMKLVHGEGARV